ncbi:FAD-binding oxidoreductase [Candidatus Saccharibacteria bacterium]|nr:FAD-binding oxidoreductase [Candidatus Saccharibacteria bacterium]
MDGFIQALKASGFSGDIDNDLKTREQYSHDASLFELVPQLVVAPKAAHDVELLVQTASAHKPTMPDLSLTARSGGTCMSGGAISESIIVDFKKYLTTIEMVTPTSAQAQPGVFYRDFEKATLAQGALMPSYPASRELCTIGGMVSNNAGGEKSLQYGKTERFVTQLQVVLADGKTYAIRPLTKAELDAKMAQQDFEGNLYRQVFKLVDTNYDRIKAARPAVSKDSTGYHLWNVWDPQRGVFDLTQVIVGSQGTLGLVTDITFRLVSVPKYSGTLVIFLEHMDNLGQVINAVLTHHPATFEGFDNYTLMLSFKLFSYFHQNLGWGGMIKLGFQLIPDALKLLRGIPKMVLLVEFNDDSPEDVKQQVHAMHLALEVMGTFMSSRS